MILAVRYKNHQTTRTTIDKSQHSNHPMVFQTEKRTWRSECADAVRVDVAQSEFRDDFLVIW